MKYIVVASILYCSNAVAQESVLEEGFPEHLLYMESSGRRGDVDAAEQNISARTWPVGQTLRVCFFGGDDVVQELVSRVASEWSSYANLRFDFGTQGQRRDCTSPGTGFSHIRVGFGGQGYWSLVGTDSARKANQYQPSLNLEAFDMDFSSFNGFSSADVVARAAPEKKAVILHEFGHAIGLLHEHQNKNLDCWSEIIKDGPNGAYAYYRRPPNGWNKEKVDRNLGIATAADPDAIAGAPDPASIMMYRLPASILQGGTSSKCFVARQNVVISQLDQQWVASFYPRGSAQQIDDEAETPYSIAAVPADVSKGLSDDFLQRVRLDLEASDAAVRRDARSRLSEYLKQPAAAPTAVELVKDLHAKSYRYQLGVAVAISGAKGSAGLVKELRPDISDALGAAKDPTLQLNLKNALQELAQ